MKICTQCQVSFQVTDGDREFYQKMDVPNPDKCPDCRNQSRLIYRNFFNLYHRKCDLTGKELISMYDAQAPFPVYETNQWWSDRFNPLDYGREFDFSRPFFEQWIELNKVVPRMSIMNTQCENADYANLSFQSKNVYMLFGNIRNEDSCYGHIVWQCKDCFDCLYIYRSEQCYECIDCFGCYNLAFSQNCENSSDSMFLLDCSGCRNCFGCVGLKNKEYYIFNQPYTKAEYKEKIRALNTGSHQVIRQVLLQMESLKKSHIAKFTHGINNENVTGDYLYNCKNVFDSYDCKNCEDSRFLYTAESFFNAYDCSFSPSKTQWAYMNIASTGYWIRFNHNSIDCSHVDYCDNAYNSKDSFGCIGLKNNQYCLLNKQYTRQEYQQLLPKVIEHLKSTREWGQFLPKEGSPFAYNETIAQEYFPLTKREVEDQGFRWKNERSKKSLNPENRSLPDDIQEADEKVLKEIFTCEATGEPFKIIAQELKFLKEHHLPLPRQSWQARHEARMKKRNPRRLYDRNCRQCGQVIQTTYAPQRPEQVYCEACYLSTLY